MALKPVTILYGSDFGLSLSLNDSVSYRSNVHDHLGGPEQEIILQDTTWSYPYDLRGKLRERVFSIWFEPVGSQPFTTAWHDKVDAVKQVFYSGPIRIVFSKGSSLRLVYITARCETITQTNRTEFEVKLTAADPLFRTYAVNEETGLPLTIDDYLMGPTREGFARVQLTLAGEDVDFPDAGDYPTMIMPYSGTAPEEPNILFQIGGEGGVYQYYRDITVTNNSPYPLRNHPICIDLGNISTNVDNAVAHGHTQSTIKFHETNHAGGDHRIRDIRVETLAGARKQIFIRDVGERGGDWHTSVKVWTVLYLLGVGESKVLRVLYGNPFAPASEVYPEFSSVKPMFNMYDSTNTAWIYADFMPTWDLPQTRAFQWSPYLPPHNNLSWISYPHPAFNLTSGTTNVNAAGGFVSVYGSVWGAAGVQLNLPIGISQLDYDVRYATNDKAPFVLRWQRRNLNWVDSVSGQPGYYSNANSTMTATLTAISAAGSFSLVCNRVTTSTEAFATGMGVLVQLDDGSWHRSTISSITSLTLTIADAIPLGRYTDAGFPVRQFKTQSSQTKVFPTSDRPLTIAFVLRGDHPELTSGDWYFGGVETLTITFASDEKPSVTAWGSAAEVDIGVSHHFQLTGRFGNSSTNEYMRINTITTNLYDRVSIDCKNRTCNYYPWDSTHQIYGVAENRIEALSWEVIRYYWIHLQPGISNVLRFIHDSNSNFRDSDVYAVYETAYY